MIIEAAITIACLNPFGDYTFPKTDPECYQTTVVEETVELERPAWTGFTATPTGTVVANNGGDQCVALVNHYVEQLMGYPHIPIGSAYELWTQFDYLPELNQHFSRSATPVKGSIVVMAGGEYNPTHGHTGVVTGVNPDGTFTTLEQNTATNRYTDRYTRDMTAVSGFLVPNANLADPLIEKSTKKVVVPYTRVYEH